MRQQQLRRTMGYGCLLFVLAGSAFVARSAEPDSRLARRHAQFAEKRQKILDDLRFELTELAQQCRAGGLDAAADDLAGLTAELTTGDSASPPAKFAQLPLSPTLPPEERRWRERLMVIRTNQARELYALGRLAQRNRHPSIAFRLIQDVLRVDPDHKHARSILGEELFHDPLRKDDKTSAGEWVTEFEAGMRGGRDPRIFDERFGWIPRSDLARYENGERPSRGSWISKEKAQEIHRDFRHAWEIPSEHFLVKTSVGLEEGVLLSRRLEQFHNWLTQNFAAFFDTPRALQERFENAHRRRRTPAAPQMEVFYFASRDEYNKRMQGKIPPGVVTNGLYWQPDRRCYFFRNEEDSDLTTLYHEATHQILDIHTARDRITAAQMLARKHRVRTQEWILCKESNFWLIEGLACYFESFEVNEEDGQISIGRPDYVRFEAARKRLLDGELHFYVPLQQFCRIGKDDFQHHPDIAPLYSQASGLAHFLMHYDDGRYRDDLVDLLSAVYRPDPKNPDQQPDLSEITGTPWGQLDQEYRGHMTTIAAENP